MVPVELQVSTVIEPLASGVHLKTRSPLDAPPHEPTTAPAPPIVPVTVPPTAGRTVGFPHVPGGNEVDVVVGTVELVTEEEVLVAGLLVEVLVELEVDVLVELLLDVLVELELEVVVVEVVLVTLVEVDEEVVVVGGDGGVIVRLKAPDWLRNPSTKMKYVSPAVTLEVTREPRRGEAPSRLIPQPTVSSLQATCVPVPHRRCRTYSTVSNVVSVALHVSKLAEPVAGAVHW